MNKILYLFLCVMSIQLLAGMEVNKLLNPFGNRIADLLNPEEKMAQKQPTGKTGKEKASRQTPYDKKYKCTWLDCNKAFSSNKALIYHTHDVHTMRKPYHCSIPECDKAFVFPGGRDKHETNHKEHIAHIAKISKPQNQQ